jgi:HNH endonuclease
MFTIIRNNLYYRVELHDIIETDLVFCADGRFHPVTTVPSLYSFLLHSQRIQRRVAAQESNGWGAVLFFIALACLVFIDFHDPSPRPRIRWRPRNDEPLTPRQKALVRARDKEICAYCGCDAPNGHVDHRVSRVNGGSNHPNNLSWACSTCNWKKGAMNARQYLRRNFT